jgi:superfamily II DNA/RNA helicase
LLFSATFEEKVRNMARKLLNDNYYYVTSNTGTGLKANDKVKQRFFQIEDENAKLDKLAELLNSEITGSVISKQTILNISNK